MSSAAVRRQWDDGGGAEVATKELGRQAVWFEMFSLSILRDFSLSILRDFSLSILGNGSRVGVHGVAWDALATRPTPEAKPLGALSPPTGRQGDAMITMALIVLLR
nr:hypothetical protein Iba_chr09fCG12110 [Ipomoea batatas]